MRVLIDGEGTVIEGEVIGGSLVSDLAGDYDLADEFTVRCDNGQCFLINGWMVEVEVVHNVPQRVM
jgi:hypothetical protein